jgi:3-dehydroquinate synthase
MRPQGRHWATKRALPWPEGCDVVRVRLAERSYDIVVGGSVGSLLRTAVGILDLKGRTCAVLFDSNTERLFSSDALAALQRSGVKSFGFSIPPGERSKTLKRAAEFIEFMLANGLDRTSFVCVVGGGVPGDLGAFAASIFMRGIPVLQVPTTLLAQVDAAIGGKTGVDLPLGKNLAGTFWQPIGVLASPAALATLKPQDYACGLAEVVKYAMVADERLMGVCERRAGAVLERDLETLRLLIRRCARTKAQVVAADERESGLRAILNYGHTVGHALEAVSSYRRLSHGEAVSIGMVVAGEIAARLGLCDRETCARQKAALESFGLPTAVPDWAEGRELISRLGLDKKRYRGRLRFVLPRRVGCVTVTEDVPQRAVTAALRVARATRKRK